MTQTVNPFPITVTAVASTKTYDRLNVLIGHANDQLRRPGRQPR